MSPPAKTLFVFGLYMVALGAILVVAPNELLSLFAFARTSEVWVRVVGMMALFLGAYDLVTARAELRALMVWSVPVRLSVIFFFAAFVSVGSAPPTLLLFGVVDFAGAVWTWAALRASPVRLLTQSSPGR